MKPLLSISELKTRYESIGHQCFSAFSASLGDVYEQMLNDLRSAGNAGEFYTPRAITQFMVQMVNPGLEKREKVLDPSCGIDAYCNAKVRCAKPGNPGAKERAKSHGRNIKSYAKDSEELSTVAKYCVLFRNDPQLARLVSSNG